jgi:hypothetical protein
VAAGDIIAGTMMAAVMRGHPVTGDPDLDANFLPVTAVAITGVVDHDGTAFGRAGGFMAFGDGVPENQAAD